jgi:hypothetical protein
MLSLAGCSSMGTSGGAASSIAAAPHAQADFGPEAGPASGSAAKSTSDVIQRQVVTTGTVVIRTKNPISAADKAADLVQAAGGRVDDRTQVAATRTAAASAELTLRIPSANLTDTLAQLKKLGTVKSIKLSSNDVTTQSQDLNARIKALQTTVDRLLALEAKSKNTADLIEIENDISDRQGDLDSLTSQQKYLNDQVSMSTITLQLTAPTAVIAAKTPSPANAFTAGLSGFGTFFTWAFLVLSYLVPWLLLAAVVTFVWILLVRRRRKRRAAEAPATS